jgi:maltose O-acetyltransferase
MSRQCLRQEVQSIRIGLENILMNAFPDCWISSRLLRPFFARVLGMECGRRTSFRKGNYYGNLRNIRVGDGTYVNKDVFFDALDTITLGSNVSIGFQVSFITSAHEFGDVERRCGTLHGMPITVEDGAWIGACARVGPGVTVGAGSVVSFGAVVARSIPANCVVAGSPARVVMQLDAAGSSVPNHEFLSA